MRVIVNEWIIGGISGYYFPKDARLVIKREKLKLFSVIKIRRGFEFIWFNLKKD